MYYKINQRFQKYVQLEIDKLGIFVVIFYDCSHVPQQFSCLHGINICIVSLTVKQTAHKLVIYRYIHHHHQNCKDMNCWLENPLCG